MPNKEMSTFVVEVDGVVSNTYDIVDSRIGSSDITEWTDKGFVYRGNVSINKSTNVATFSSITPNNISYGNGATKGINVISLFYDNENNDIYTLSGHEYVSDSGSRLTYTCITGTTLKKIVTNRINSVSPASSLSGTYSESTLVSSVDGKSGAVTVLPSGGTTGQILKKTSGTNYAVEWANETGAVTSVNGQTGAVTIAETPPEIFIGTTTPSGYTLYIDPTGSLESGEGVSF